MHQPNSAESRTAELQTGQSELATPLGSLPKLAIATCVLGTAAAVLWLGWQIYARYYDSMHAYHMDGLPFMVLLALGLSVLTTPFFAAAVSQGPDDAPRSIRQAIQLYAGVLGIQFAALTTIFFGLWVLGWLRVVLYVAYRWFLSLFGL